MESDTASILIACLLLVLCLGVGGFFTLVETAVTEAHHGRLERLAQDSQIKADTALSMLDTPERTLSLAQVGITFTGIIIGIGTGLLLAPLIGHMLPPRLAGIWWLSLAIAILMMTCITLLVSEFIPKHIALQNPEKVLLRHQRGLSLLLWLLGPLLIVLDRAAHITMLLLGINPDKQTAVTEDEVKDLIEQGAEDGTFERSEQAMVDRIFHMSDQTAYALMTPRTQMLWLDLSDSLKHNLRLIRKTQQDVFPVGRDSLDEFCGILYAKDLLNAALENKSLNIAQYLHKPLFVPRSMEILRVLEKFKASGVHEAMVLDEYGGVIGFLTLDDLLGELIGDESTTTSPSEAEHPQIVPRDDHTWTVDGLCPIDEFKKMFDIDELPDEEHDHYQTMGGFVTSCFGHIPHVHERCHWQDFTFEIKKMDRARVDTIIMTQKK